MILPDDELLVVGGDIVGRGRGWDWIIGGDLASEPEKGFVAHLRKDVPAAVDDVGV